MTLITDGKGQGNAAEVNGLNKLATFSITESEEEFHALEGQKFNILTSILNIDDSDESAVLYFKNNSDRDFVILAYGMMLGTSTGGTGGEWVMNSVRNPTAGTLITNGVTITPINFNAGSPKILTATTLEMDVNNRTFTDGTDPWIATLGTTTGLQIVDVGSIIIPPGTAFGLTFNDQPSNTSRNVQAFIVGHEELFD